MKAGIGMVVACVLLTGCISQGAIAPGNQAQLWHGTDRLGSWTLVAQHCPPNRTCEAVTVYAEPPGDAAYSYVFKVKHRALIGIPYGEEPVTVYVVGDHAACMTESGSHMVRADGRVNEGNLRLSADPTERCAGPVYVRR